ncbi:MAG: class I SAM-dependent RNA methyltransferase, partial [Clostridia bacterium]|nr:class I SAM-dependent RNA methyltransferase [Clostridia bacterium]
MSEMTFCCPCLFGIEGILGDELRRMGADNVQVQTGRVLFTGDFSMMARVNIQSRYAERVQLVMGTFRAVTFEQLFEGTKALPWERFIGKTDRFPVKGWSLNSTLHSVPDCQSIVKKAVVERLKGHYGIGWFEESGALFQIQVTILKDEVSLLIDTSGAGLHKRGYRANAGEAPIKETLAAAIADVMRVRFAQQVCDPCCGSGTLLIEAALAARRIAPGVRRRFAAMNWG